MKLRWAEPVAAAAGTALIKTLAATWRYRESGTKPLQRPLVFVLWHSRILSLLPVYKNEGLVLLVSRHRDGGYLVDLATGWGYRSVRGSTQRGGEIGLLRIVRALEEGAIVAMTPDGPRGPAERVQPGAVAAAQHAGVPIVGVGARVSAAWHLRSWDRQRIPKPFARIDVVYGSPIRVGPGKDGIRQGIAAVQHSLEELNG